MIFFPVFAGGRRMPTTSTSARPGATSCWSPRRERARPRTRSPSRPNCSPGARSRRSPSSRRPSTSSTSGRRRPRRFGIAIDSAYRNAQGRAGADFAGVAVTYAQVAAHPALHRQRTENRRTLVIFDEIHHAGDALSWGDAVKEAFDPARRRLALTGTPFRSDANPIPFVTYTTNRAAASAAPRTTSTATGPRWRTAWSGR